MKEKIANALKTEYASFGLSQKALDGVAQILEKTITKEEDINAAIKEASVQSLLKVFQSETDTLRTAKSAAEKALEEYKKEHPGKKPEVVEKDEVAQAIAELKAKQEEYDRMLADGRAKEKLSTMKNAVAKLLEEKGCNHKYTAERVLETLTEVKDGDTAESLAENLAKSYDTEYVKIFGAGAKPRMGGGEPKQGYQKGEFGDFIKKMQAEGTIPKNEN